MKRRTILLTGAGFSYNFGFPLAIQVWNNIFNHPRVQADDLIRSKMLEVDNYEDLYDEVCKMPDSNSRANFLEAINEVFNIYFEDICIRSVHDKTISKVDYQKIKLFIQRFSGTNSGSGYFFTTNQDLFIERLFFNEIYNPIIGNCIWDYAPNSKQPAYNQRHSVAISIPGTNYSGIYLPTQDELNDKLQKSNIENRLETGVFPLYFKLHGSIGWKQPPSSAKKELPIVMGHNKKNQIDAEPLFSFYFSKFSEALLKNNTSLMVIGYSFSDIHINEIILKAIRDHDLRLHIINPKSIKDFKEDLCNNRNCIDSQKIYGALGGYYQATLQDIFPSPELIGNHHWKQIEKNFFN